MFDDISESDRVAAMLRERQNARNRRMAERAARAQPNRETLELPGRAAPTPAPRQPAAMRMAPAELEAERAAMMEANQPAGRSASARQRGSRAAAPRGMSEADRLNAISQAFIRGERPRGGAADTIGKAMGIEGYKKGGLIEPKKVVKKAAGGMLKTPKAPAAPGRGPGRPATSVKPVGTRAMAKAAAPKKPVGMPAFKKGGKVSMKKGKK